MRVGPPKATAERVWFSKRETPGAPSRQDAKFGRARGRCGSWQGADGRHEKKMAPWRRGGPGVLSFSKGETPGTPSRQDAKILRCASSIAAAETRAACARTQPVSANRSRDEGHDVRRIGPARSESHEARRAGGH